MRHTQCFRVCCKAGNIAITVVSYIQVHTWHKNDWIFVPKINAYKFPLKLNILIKNWGFEGYYFITNLILDADGFFSLTFSVREVRNLFILFSAEQAKFIVITGCPNKFGIGY